MEIGRSISTQIAAHNALKTGVHAVGADYIAKAVTIDQLIRNADVAAAAAIVYSKLNLGLSVVNADVAAAAAIALSKLAAMPALATSGSYAGDGTANRAIAHGLGVIPKVVLLMTNNDQYWYRIIVGRAVITYLSASTTGSLAVTAPNATNFYVGNATNYTYSANEAAGPTYYWVAIG